MMTTMFVKDVLECDDDTLNDCDVNADCVEATGGYQCVCHEGFMGDGYTSGTGCTKDCDSGYFLADSGDCEGLKLDSFLFYIVQGAYEQLSHAKN